MKRGWIAILFMNVFTSFGQQTSEDFQTIFTNHLKENNLEALQQIVQQWRTALPDDAEGFVATFNYYLLQATNSDIIEEQEPARDSVFLQNREQLFVDSALLVLDQGLNQHPMRLDMYMGYIYTLGQNQRWEEFTPRILTLLERAKRTQFKGWLWSNNREVGNEAKMFIVESIADYQYMLYNTYSNERLLDIRKIAVSILNVYESHIDQLNFMALSYSELGDFTQAYKWIKKALLIAPEIPEVVANYERILKGAFKKKQAKKELNFIRKNAEPKLYEVLTRIYYSL